MADKGFDTKVAAPASKPTIGKNAGKTGACNGGKGIGPKGSPVVTVPDSGVVAKDKPFGSGGNGVIEGKV